MLKRRSLFERYVTLPVGTWSVAHKQSGKVQSLKGKPPVGVQEKNAKGIEHAQKRLGLQQWRRLAVV